MTGDCLEALSWLGQGLSNTYQKYAFTLKTGPIKQMHEAIASPYTIEPDASPSSEFVLANLVVLYLESVDQLN